MTFLTKLIVSALAVVIASYFLPGVIVSNVMSAVAVACILALLNTFLKPLLVILTIPITLLTFGLFLILINVFIIWIADSLVPGFAVSGFGSAIIFSILLSVITSLLERLEKSLSK